MTFTAPQLWFLPPLWLPLLFLSPGPTVPAASPPCTSSLWHEPYPECFASNILSQICTCLFSPFKSLFKCYPSDRPSLITLNQIKPFLLHFFSWHLSTHAISLYTRLYMSDIYCISIYIYINVHTLRAESLFFSLPYRQLLGSYLAYNKYSISTCWMNEWMDRWQSRQKSSLRGFWKWSMVS